ncbi:MAG: nucleotidyltransferase domain-containing protein [Caldilineales bacterium]|nr:nucleotidyltransferase domain-containing protein [Caldilineales bacterium]MDW8318223.1 nucleotidyltransferase domain-containing protein [Anaerolineae bacterium]
MSTTEHPELSVYQRTALAREERRAQARAARRQRGLEVARQAAALLRDRYGATRVVLFGSAARGRGFGEGSDLDLAAEGIPAKAFWQAWAALDTLDPTFEINLVAFEEATPSLLAAIEAEGMEL